MYYFISMYIYISNESQRISQPELFWESRPETPWSPVFHWLAQAPRAVPMALHREVPGALTTWDLLGGRLRWVLRLEIDQQASTNCGVFSFLGGGAVCLRSPEKRKLRRWTGVHKCEGCSCGSWLLPRLLCQRVSNAPLVVDGRASMVLQRTVCPQENVQKSSLCRTWFPGTAIIWNLFNLIHRALKPPQCRDCS